MSTIVVECVFKQTNKTSDILCIHWMEIYKMKSSCDWRHSPTDLKMVWNVSKSCFTRLLLDRCPGTVSDFLDFLDIFWSTGNLQIRDTIIRWDKNRERYDVTIQVFISWPKMLFWYYFNVRKILSFFFFFCVISSNGIMKHKCETRHSY